MLRDSATMAVIAVGVRGFSRVPGRSTGIRPQTPLPYRLFRGFSATWAAAMAGASGNFDGVSIGHGSSR